MLMILITHVTSFLLQVHFKNCLPYQAQFFGIIQSHLSEILIKVQLTKYKDDMGLKSTNYEQKSV